VAHIVGCALALALELASALNVSTRKLAGATVTRRGTEQNRTGYYVLVLHASIVLPYHNGTKGSLIINLNDFSGLVKCEQD